MAYDFKREYKDLYLPKTKPALIEVPSMNFVAVAGSGDPNEEGGAYKQALELLYAFSYTVKMSKMSDWQPNGYFDYVVPPLEGLWWDSATPFDGTGIQDKSNLSWISLIRQPDFVTRNDFDHVCSLVADKKPKLASLIGEKRLHYVCFSEGRCVQIMHKGPFDNEPSTIAKLKEFALEQELTFDIASIDGRDPEEVIALLDCAGGVAPVRLHHEIYLGDPRRTKPENLKTVIRHPIL